LPPFLHWSLLILGAGVLSLVAAALTSVRRARFSRRAQAGRGHVTRIDSDSSGEYPIVAFSPDGGLRAGGRVIELSRHHAASGCHIGQEVPVLFDPADPTDACLDTPDAHAGRRHMMFMLIAMGILMLALGASMKLFIQPIEISSAERDRAVLAYLAAARRDDDDAIRALTTSNYSADPSVLRERLQPSRDYEQGNSFIDFNDRSCVRGIVRPGPFTVVFRLHRQRDRWLIERVSSNDPECEDLDD
jgi:hypothetical protein